MKRTLRYFGKLWIALVLLGAAAVCASASDTPRQHLSLDLGWKFHLGDDWPDALRRDKAGVSSGAASPLVRAQPCTPRSFVP